MGVITAALSQDSNDDNAQPRGNSYTTVYTWLPMLHQTQAYKDISLSLYIFDWKPLCHVKLRSNKFLYLSLVNLSFATEVSAIPLCSVKQSNYPLYPQSAQAEKQAGPPVPLCVHLFRPHKCTSVLFSHGEPCCAYQFPCQDVDTKLHKFCTLEARHSKPK